MDCYPHLQVRILRIAECFWLQIAENLSQDGVNEKDYILTHSTESSGYRWDQSWTIQKHRESAKTQVLPISLFQPQTHTPHGYKVAATAPEVTADVAMFSRRRDLLLGLLGA